jgi:GntR family transcriptional regulator, N-acetylglucosamine utilization regulator
MARPKDCWPCWRLRRLTSDALTRRALVDFSSQRAALYGIFAVVVNDNLPAMHPVTLSRKPLPLYHQLKELVSEKIESGEWGPGYRLPTESELTAQFGVSRVTVRQALQLLANQGLVERKQGLGTFVARPKVAHNLLWMYRDGKEVKEHGGEIRYRLHSVVERKPSAFIAQQLHIDADSNVYEVKRSLLADNEPLMFITNWLPVSLFAGFTDYDFGPRTMMNVLHDYGYTVAHQHKEVEITILDEEEAASLEVESGAPALLLTFLSYLTDGTPFEFRRTYVRGDRCKYYVDIDRPELLI